MPRCPVVGISGYAEQARWGEAWDLPAALLPQAYVDSVTKAGAIPVILPAAEDGAAVVQRLDGLILAGGSDIAPERYGAAPVERTAGVQESRDTAEFELLDAALERDVPVLGICRGMQVMNIARGGTLHQHLPDVVDNHDHRQRLARFDPHPVTVTPDTRTAQALGRTKLDVPSYHHQGLASLGNDVVATAWTEDGIVEAIEYTGMPHVLGVQWHPEMGDDPSLFDWIVASSR